MVKGMCRKISVCVCVQTHLDAILKTSVAQAAGSNKAHRYSHFYSMYLLYVFQFTESMYTGF